MRKEDAWEGFCCGRQGCLGEVRGEDWLGCFRGERGALVLLSLETAIIVVIVALCAGDSLLFTSDRRCALRVHCCQAETPPTTSWRVPGDVVHPLLLWLSGSTLLPRTGCCLLSEPPRLAGLIVSPPGWVLLTRHMLLLPSCRPLPCIPHSPASSTQERGGSPGTSGVSEFLESLQKPHTCVHRSFSEGW